MNNDSDSTTRGRGRPPKEEGEVAESNIHLRVTRDRKAAYVRKASAAGQTLAAWCFEHLDKAAGYKPEAKPD